ncbi:hypothetical protein CBL_01842 [Carabus blaptoides fortunei]
MVSLGLFKTKLSVQIFLCEYSVITSIDTFKKNNFSVTLFNFNIIIDTLHQRKWGKYF